MTKLSLATLDRLPRSVAVPGYRRDQLKAGIVHIGVGNFHRAHFAVYLDALFNLGLDHGWAIVGAGLMPFDSKVRDALREQDYLNTIVEQDNDLSSARVTGPMIDFVPPGDIPALMARLVDPAIRIVSLTVTEGGYMIDPASGKFDPAHPAIVRDAANPAAPASVFGVILRGLVLRRDQGIAPFTVMSCDNLPHNGSVTRHAVAGLARLIDPALGDWVTANVAFPNAMVDRITPATTDRERRITREQFGIDDNWPVFCEEFKQWVIEDKFCMGRPAFEKAGATFVSDVSPWEAMKIRILNGGHAVLAYAGGLLDVHYVHEAMEHPVVRPFFDKVETTEIVPTVPPVPGTDLGGYYRLIARRFSNPKIGDTIRRLALDGSNRQPKFIVPVIADRLAAGQAVEGLALESALWCRYCFGTTDSGAAIEPNDPSWDRLQDTARAARNTPESWLQMKDIYGGVADSPPFADRFAANLRSLWDNGVPATIMAYVNSQR